MLKNKHISLIAIVAICFIILYFPVWKHLIISWFSSDEYSYGFFILPISCYILWQKRNTLSRLPNISSKLGLVVLIFSLAFYILATIAGILTITAISMIFALAGVVIYLWGLNVFKEVMFPLFFLLFMIPIPAQIYSSITSKLQLLVSETSVWFSILLNLPAYREGNIIYLPEQTLQVVSACSGLRSLTSIMTISVILGYLTLNSIFLRFILFCIGIPVAILVNIIRVLLVILAFYYFKYDLTDGFEHTILGVAIFILALILLMIMKGILSSWQRVITKG